MTSEELWRIYCARNPKFREPEAHITFTQAGLKKFFDQTFKKGYEHGGNVAGRFFDTLFPSKK